MINAAAFICPYSHSFRLFWWAYCQAHHLHSSPSYSSKLVSFSLRWSAHHSAEIGILNHNGKFLTPKMICTFWFGKFFSDRLYHYGVNGSHEQTGTCSYKGRTHFKQSFYTFLFYIYRCWFGQLSEYNNRKRVHHRWNQI